MSSIDASVGADVPSAARGADGAGDGAGGDARGRPLRVILGPTAAGKSALAMALAAVRRVAIVSADSRQLYRGFDIGTAKPTREDREAVPHCGIDVAEPTTRWSAHAWATAAEGWIADARRSGREPVIVGGTGFYVRALVHPLAPVPTLDPARRERLETWLGQLSNEELARWCRRLDPARAGLGRTQRLRAIETALLAGTPLSASYGDDAGRAPSPPRDVRYLVVDPGPVLAQRIEARIRAMVAAGWVEEVRRLLEQVPASAPAWQASGYAAIRAHLQGTCTLDEAVRQVVIETRQYAKRQRTWNRHQLGDGSVCRVDPTAADAMARVLAWWDDPDRPEDP